MEMTQVLVLGNVAVDETFVVEDLPDPGASVSAQASGESVGGKGANQAVAAARGLAAQAGTSETRVTLIAAVGADARAAKMRAALADEPLTARLAVRHTIASDVSIILRSRAGADVPGTKQAGENIVITTQDAARSLTPEDALTALAGFRVGDVLMLQGNLAPETTLAALTGAGAQGMVRVLNPSPVEAITPAHLAQADILVLNEREAAHFAGRIPARAQCLRTLGSRGALLDGGAVVPAPKATALDPTGAGDCFLGAAVAAMIRRGGQRLAAADLAFAARAAAITVTRRGTFAAFPSVAEFASLSEPR
jgi:ribokinase